jgi:ubiquinol-cytochrome c reductase cytochrome c1 subunit
VLRSSGQGRQNYRSYSSTVNDAIPNDLFVVGVLGGVYLGSLLVSSKKSAECSGDNLPAPKLDWAHSGYFSTYDSASLRRGFEVYRQVCATCHSLSQIRYRELIGVSHTKEQAEALAKSIEVDGGFDDQGNAIKRPGALYDRMPEPYPNKSFARFANNGAIPPDLSLITKARHGGADYVFALITGYGNPPAGITMRENQYYNPYMPGGIIAMPPPLATDGQLEYEDGTPATITQMAKDVSAFLSWTAEPEANERKKFAFQALPVIAFAVAFSGYYKRFRFTVVKNRKVTYLPLKYK